MGSEEAEGVSVVDYATWNEFGTSRAPSRAFMAETYDRHHEDLMKFTDFLVTGMVNGRIHANGVLSNLGMQYQAWIQAMIRDAVNWAEPNAESTIARKGSSSPLIDKGRLIQAIRYEVQ